MTDTAPPAVPREARRRPAAAVGPVARRLAGRRFFPTWAVVHHRGRRTGRDLEVPVAVLVTGSDVVIGLPWGPGTNWVRNVLAEGGCELTWRGATRPAGDAELIPEDVARGYYNAVTWWAGRTVFGAQGFLRLHLRRP